MFARYEHITTLFSFQRTISRNNKKNDLSKLSKTRFLQLDTDIYTPQKGGDPSPPSGRDTLLRLKPSHRSYLRRPPPLLVRLTTSGIIDSHALTGGVYNTRERIHPNILIWDYQRFQLREVELQTSVRTGTDFKDLLGFTTLRLFVSAIVARLQPQT